MLTGLLSSGASKVKLHFHDCFSFWWLPVFLALWPLPFYSKYVTPIFAVLLTSTSLTLILSLSLKNKKPSDYMRPLWKIQNNISIKILKLITHAKSLLLCKLVFIVPEFRKQMYLGGVGALYSLPQISKQNSIRVYITCYDC